MMLHNYHLQGKPGFGGKYQFHAIVGAAAPKDGSRTKVNVVVWSDDRYEACKAAIAVAAGHGYRDCTVNHITKAGGR